MPASDAGPGSADPAHDASLSDGDRAAIRWVTAAMIVVGVLMVGAVGGAVRAGRGHGQATSARGPVAAARLVAAAKGPSAPVAAIPSSESGGASGGSAGGGTVRQALPAPTSSPVGTASVARAPVTQVTQAPPAAPAPAPAPAPAGPQAKLTATLTVPATPADAATATQPASTATTACVPHGGQPCWNAAAGVWDCPNEVTGGVAPCTPAELHILQSGLPWYVKAQDCILGAGCRFGTKYVSGSHN